MKPDGCLFKMPRLLEPCHAWQLPGHSALEASTINFPTEIKLLPARKENGAMVAQLYGHNSFGWRRVTSSSPSWVCDGEMQCDCGHLMLP